MKWIAKLAMMICCMLILTAVGMAEDNVFFLSGDETNAYIVTVEGKSYLLGYVDQEKFNVSATERVVDYVVQYCNHEDHVALKKTLAEILNANVIDVADLPESMKRGEGIICGEKAFSAEKKIADMQTLDCLGNYLKFSASTNESSVNVRESASTKAKRVDKLKRGETLTVLGETVNDKGEIWYQVQLSDGKIGYIRSDLLEVADSVPETKEKVTNSDKKEQRYIGNKKSKVFHRENCEHLPSSKNIVYFSSRSYAVSKGYKPCSHCDP